MGRENARIFLGKKRARARKKTDALAIEGSKTYLNSQKKIGMSKITPAPGKGRWPLRRR